jgi:integrase
MVVGSVNEFLNELAARQATAALRLDINPGDARVKARPITISELVDHYRQRELEPDTIWKTHSTKVTYEGYLNKWILPRWGNYLLTAISAGEVELWLRSLPLARSSCAKIRNLMSVLFNHGIRHEICDRNPIQLVRQSAKRKRIPALLSATEVQQLIAALSLRERTLVLLDFGTGLRMSELFALKWRDINFHANEISVTRSIVMQVVGSCKTEASQKPIPLDPYLAEALQAWRQHTQYRARDDWVFASPEAGGRRPYWGQCIMRRFIRPTAARIGISQRIGWHTFRHYAESETMPNRDSETLRKQRESCGSSVVLLGSMRHSPVCFTGHGGSSALAIRSFNDLPLPLFSIVGAPANCLGKAGFPGWSRMFGNACLWRIPSWICSVFRSSARVRLCRIAEVRKSSGCCHGAVIRHIPEFGIVATMPHSA